MTSISVLEWLGSIAGIAGALLMAMNTRFSAWAYPLWIVSSMALMGFALLCEHKGLGLQQTVFLAINTLGVWRWIVRPPVSGVVGQRI